MHRFQISREIGIDAGHRVMTHGSKCRNLHGHRYKVIAHCSAGALQLQGEQQDMVLDFGFLKELMMKHIDETCDHGMILSAQDEAMLHLLAGDSQIPEIKRHTTVFGRWRGTGVFEQKLYVIPGIPTAEVLAHHWFDRLYVDVLERSNNIATLSQVEVWETPNCVARYPA